ncbi:MAG: hypothetical protein K9W43_07670 [Candidatus Thorarchaeota archaeon]|nr:hypothetical protein [Candidatus Thorarchaeota archaeon]
MRKLSLSVTEGSYLTTAVSIIILIANRYMLQTQTLPEIHQLITISSGAVLIVALPYLVIEKIYHFIKNKAIPSTASTQGGQASKPKSIECGGLQGGGALIGACERLLIFIAFLIASYETTLSYMSIMSFLSIIVAGKAIFRYSIGSNQISDQIDTKACADWHILGTLMSMIWGLLIAWIVFHFLMVR